MAKVLIDIPDETYEYVKQNYRYGIGAEVACKLGFAVAEGTVLPKGHDKLLDVDVVKQKVFDITDLYDSGKYLVFEDGKYLIGDDIENDNRRILSFNEALQGVINGMSAIIEADKKGE